MAGVELSAGEAEPGYPCVIPEERALRQRRQVLQEAPGMELFRFRDAPEGGGNAGIPLLRGDAGGIGVERVPLFVLGLQDGTEDFHRFAGQADGEGVRLGEGLSAVGRQEAAEDIGVLLFLRGGEAERMGDHMQVGVLHAAGSVQIEPLRLRLSHAGALEIAVGLAVHKGRTGGLYG